MTHHEHHIVIWGVTKQEQEEAWKWLLVPSVANCLPGQASQRNSSNAASREEFLESRGGSVFLDQLLVCAGLSCCLQGPGTVPVLVLLYFCRSEVLEWVSPRWPQDWFFWKLWGLICFYRASNSSSHSLAFSSVFTSLDVQLCCFTPGALELG